MKVAQPDRGDNEGRARAGGRAEGSEGGRSGSTEGGTPLWVSTVAGLTGGFVSSMTMHPLDVVNTRFQVQDGKVSHIPSYRSTGHALVTIARKEGLRSLYSGLTPNLIGSTISWGSYFYGYTFLRNLATRAGLGRESVSGGGELGAGMNLVCASAAGVVTTMLTQPIWLAKTRLQLQTRFLHAHDNAAPPPSQLPLAEHQRRDGAGGPEGGRHAAPSAHRPSHRRNLEMGREAGREAAHHQRPYSGILSVWVRVSREEGWAALYRGLVPSLWLVSHVALHFMAYEELKFYARRQLAGAREPEAAETFVMATAAKTFASVATYPFMVIRARMQQKDPNLVAAVKGAAPPEPYYRGLQDVVNKTYRGEGARGFYKGLYPNLLRVVPSAAITFVVYEQVVTFLR